MTTKCGRNGPKRAILGKGQAESLARGSTDVIARPCSFRFRGFSVRLTIGFVATIAFLAASTVAFAGGRPPGVPSGFDAPPTNDQIRGRLKELCVGLLTNDGKREDLANRRCGCYSDGVVKAMTPAELDEMRTTGKFAQSARPKAVRFMQSCRVNS